MISFREARERVDALPWPHGVSYLLSKDMMYFTVHGSSVIGLNALQVVDFKDCVDKAMAYLHAVNPAIVLRVR